MQILWELSAQRWLTCDPGLCFWKLSMATGICQPGRLTLILGCGLPGLPVTTRVRQRNIDIIDNSSNSSNSSSRFLRFSRSLADVCFYLIWHWLRRLAEAGVRVGKACRGSVWVMTFLKWVASIVWSQKHWGLMQIQSTGLVETPLMGVTFDRCLASCTVGASTHCKAPGASLAIAQLSPVACSCCQQTFGTRNHGRCGLDRLRSCKAINFGPKHGPNKFYILYILILLSILADGLFDIARKPWFL